MKMITDNSHKEKKIPFDFIYDEYKLIDEGKNNACVGTLFTDDGTSIKELHGSTLRVEDTLIYCDSKENNIPALPEGSTTQHVAYDSSEEMMKPDEVEAMQNQDRYINARLEGIEGKLDARIESIQKLQENAEKRFEESTKNQETALRDLTKKIEDKFEDTRKHTTNVAFGSFAIIGLFLSLTAYWISEQGNYAKSYGDTKVEIYKASEDRKELTRLIESIESSQKLILEKISNNTSPSPINNEKPVSTQ